MQTDPEANWIFVMFRRGRAAGRQASGHCPRRARRQEETPRRSRVDPGPSRFLSDPTLRIRFVYLPKHSSWLNQIEVDFEIVSKRVMRHGSFTSTDDLRSNCSPSLSTSTRRSPTRSTGPTPASQPEPPKRHAPTHGANRHKLENLNKSSPWRHRTYRLRY